VLRSITSITTFCGSQRPLEIAVTPNIGHRGQQLSETATSLISTGTAIHYTNPRINNCINWIRLTRSAMTNTASRQALRRWGNSLGIRLPAAIARAAHLRENQDIELTLVDEGVLIRACQPRLSLDQRLDLYEPLGDEPIEAMAWEPLGAERIE